MSESANDGMLSEWGSRLFFGMPAKGKKSPSGRVPLIAEAAALLAGSEVRHRVRAAVRPGAKQVMVKITGGGRGMKPIAAHMRYISRLGKPEVGGRGQTLELEDQDGERISGAQGIKDLQFVWKVAGSEIPQESHRRAFNIVLSMPAGTPPRHVLDAAREFARETFKGHKYVFVMHEDTDSPHVHLAVRAERWDGFRLNPRKADLQRWRERFASSLQDKGVQAISIRSSARGVRRVPRELWHARKPKGTVRRARRERSPPASRSRALEAWRGVARALAESVEPSDRELALDVVRYVDRQFGEGRALNRLRAGPDRAGQARDSPDVERG